MEFQTDEDKRKRTIKLFTGYILMGIAILLASFILVYVAQGYNYDPNKGVSRSGLVFVESKPSAANIFINNQQKDQTNTRLVLEEGSYNLSIKKDKYRDWQKQFSIEGGSVLYFAYPKLFPVDIALGITKVFDNAPVWVSQSLDRHWLVVQQTYDAPVLTIFDLLKPSDPPTLFTLPSEQLLNGSTRASTITPIEWSDDNKHLLVSQKHSGGNIAYIVIDRENGDQTVNVSNKFDLPVTSSVKLKDKKHNEYYVLDSIKGDLYSADLKNNMSEKPILSGVVAYKSYADNLIMYVTHPDLYPSDAIIEVLNGDNKYLLQSIKREPNANYLLDIAQFQKKWYYVVSSVNSDRVNIYRNPLSRSEPGNTKPIQPQISLKIDKPQFVSFSDNTRFISVQSGKKFVIYDAEQLKPYRFESSLNIIANQQAKWMDGHRLSVVTDGKARVFEFDGTNTQTLVNSRSEFLPYYDRDYKYIFTLIQQADGKTGLESGKLIVD
jgi:hypothetical protein